MKRLHSALEGLASRGTPRGADEIFSDATKSVSPPISESVERIDQGDEIMATSAVSRRQYPAWLMFAAAFGVVLIVGLAVTLLVRPTGTDTGREAAGNNTDSRVVPGPTLPPSDNVPLTVPAGSDLSYYSYLPDLHLGWRAAEDGNTDLCWKTASDEGCESDLFYAPDTVVIPNGNHVIVLTRPALGGEAPAEAVVTFSNGETANEAFTTRSGIAIAFARVEVPDGVTVTSASAH
jgi:hypothetical protein